jgi:hypothetical protein
MAHLTALAAQAEAAVARAAEAAEQLTDSKQKLYAVGGGGGSGALHCMQGVQSFLTTPGAARTGHPTTPPSGHGLLGPTGPRQAARAPPKVAL